MARRATSFGPLHLAFNPPYFSIFFCWGGGSFVFFLLFSFLFRRQIRKILFPLPPPKKRTFSYFYTNIYIYICISLSFSLFFCLLILFSISLPCFLSLFFFHSLFVFFLPCFFGFFLEKNKFKWNIRVLCLQRDNLKDTFFFFLGGGGIRGLQHSFKY